MSGASTTEKRGKGLAFIAVVDAGFQNYLPIYAHSALTAYPECGVIFATDGRFSRRVRPLLDEIGELGDLRLLENVFDEMPHRCQEDVQFRRFMFDHAWLDDFDYLYIADTDVIVCPETPTLAAQHVEQAGRFDLAYSNVLRTTTNFPRLCGCHFTINGSYLPAARPVMARYRDGYASGQIPTRTNDEHMLFCLVAEAGLGFPPRGEAFIGMHGIHLGFWTKKYLRTGRGLPDGYFDDPRERGYYEHLLRLQKDELFQRCANLVRGDVKRMTADYRARFG